MGNFFLAVKEFIISKYFLKQIGLIILVYLGIVLGLMLFLRYETNHGEKIEVPNLIGKSSEEGKKILSELGLQYQILDSIYDPSKPVGTIVSQHPEATAISQLFVKSGRIISLRVSKNKELVEIPELIGREIIYVRQSLQSRGIVFDIHYRPTNEANGAVLEVLFKGNPISTGTRVPRGARVLLIVGEKTEEEIEVPNLIGLSFNETRTVLDSLGVPTSYFFINCLTSSDSSSAKVTEQGPEYIPGFKVTKSTPFTLKLSNDPPNN